MILKVFSLMDMKAGFFTPPFMFPSVGQALRAVTDLVGDVNTSIGRHPGDYALYQLGDWDDMTGRYTMFQQFAHMGMCTDFLPVKPRVRDMFESDPDVVRSAPQ